MAKQMKGHKRHCLVVPYPTQGHINPMLQFSRLLEHKGINVTLVLTRHIRNTLKKSTKLDSISSNIALDTISDGKEEVPEQLDHRTYLARFKQLGSQTLAELIEKYCSSDCPVNCIVYDAFMPWALDVAKRFDLFGAVFFTQSCAASNIYNYVYQGKLDLPLKRGCNNHIAIPGLPILEPTDLPSFIHELDSYPGVLEFFLNQFSNLDRADWVLMNTFNELEEKEIIELGNILPVKAIGPTVPSIYSDKQLHRDKEYGVNVYTPENDACIKWLNEKNQGSAIFVSFGSVADITTEQMEELALALQRSEKNFLWVVRTSERAKLPEHFLNETCERGLVVSWCPQLEVLGHKAIGCFVTHCGWNSTLEAISLGVPMVAVPQWTDQSTNAKYIIDVWENGIKAIADKNGIVRREEFEHCISEVMDGEKGKKLRSNAGKWMQLALKAVDKGGSSDKNVSDFVTELTAKSTNFIEC